MNAKFLSLLFILFLGIGFSSCSKDNESSYDSGKNQGIKFREALIAYKSGNSADKIQAGLNIVSIYQQYKTNSSNKDWKEGFLGGASDFDTSKYGELEKLLNLDLNLNSISADTINDLLSLLL